MRNNGVTEIPAVVTVSGHINQGDDDKFANTIDGIKSATVYFESPAEMFLPA